MPVALRAEVPAALLATGFIVTGLIVTELIVTGLAAGCGTSGSPGPPTVTSAEPAVAPTGGPAPVGTLVPLGAPATEVVVDPRTRMVAVALLGPPRLLLRSLSLDDNGTTSTRELPLPGPAADLVLATERSELLVPVSAPGCLIRVPLGGGAPSRIDLDGSARGAVAVGRLTVIALGDHLVILDGDRTRRTIRGFADAARLVPVGTAVGVLDRQRSAVSVVDLSSGEISPALRAGNGAADAVADRFGRMLVTDARDGELLAFAGNPPILRQRFPLPGAPYGLAYDSQRDLAWVSLTARDEVVGLGVAAGEPVVVHRFAAVHQPDAVAVDPVSGRVLVASASGMGLQIIDPERVVH